ncbi:MAG: radical SAM protein, partial [Lachnospiraceae bacterium]
YGIICFGMGVTLREGDREYFYAALDKYFPGLKQRYQKKYGNAYELPSEHNKELMAMFVDMCRQNNIVYQPEKCFQYLQEFPEKYEQLSFI